MLTAILRSIIGGSSAYGVASLTHALAKVLSPKNADKVSMHDYINVAYRTAILPKYFKSKDNNVIESDPQHDETFEGDDSEGLE